MFIHFLQKKQNSGLCVPSASTYSSVRVAGWLHLLTSDHDVQGPNPARGGIQQRIYGPSLHRAQNKTPNHHHHHHFKDLSGALRKCILGVKRSHTMRRGPLYASTVLYSTVSNGFLSGQQGLHDTRTQIFIQSSSRARFLAVRAVVS